jgi:hypothetical protein
MVCGWSISIRRTNAKHHIQAPSKKAGKKAAPAKKAATKGPSKVAKVRNYGI